MPDSVQWLGSAFLHISVKFIRGQRIRQVTETQGRKAAANGGSTDQHVTTVAPAGSLRDRREQLAMALLNATGMTGTLWY